MRREHAHGHRVWRAAPPPSAGGSGFAGRLLPQRAPRHSVSSLPLVAGHPIMAEMESWPHQGMFGVLSERYNKDDSWLMSTVQMKTYADQGHVQLFEQSRPRPGTTPGGLRSSSSLRSLASHPSLPSLKIRDRERNPVIGCLPDEVRITALLRVRTMAWRAVSRGVPVSRSLAPPAPREGDATRPRVGP